MFYVTVSITTGDMNITKDEDGFVFDSYPQRVFVAFILMVVFVTGTIGNSLTILAVVTSRKLQNATNTFVMNLAVSDFLACIFIPWSIAGLLIRGDWPESLSFFCTLAGGVLSVSVGCSFYSLASIALNRLILITCSKHMYHKIFSVPARIVWIVVIWAIPFSFVILPPIFGIGALGFNPKYRTCSDISVGYHDNASQTYDFIQAAGVFPLPMLVLVVSYGKILHYVWSHSRMFVTQEIVVSNNVAMQTTIDETTMTSSSVDSPVPKKSRKISVAMSAESLNKIEKNPEEGATLKRVKRMSRREMQVTKNLFIIFCAFMICLLPYVVCLVIDDTDPAIPYVAAILLINSCVNPIIYAVRFPNFKMIFKHILKCRWYSIPEPSRLLTRLKCGCGCCTSQYV